MNQIYTSIRSKRTVLILWLMLILAGTLIPLFAGSYVLRAFSIFYLYLILGVGLTIVVTYAGLLDLGYIAFFAVGAYTYALLNTYTGLPFIAALPIGMLTAACFGLLLGFPTLRVRGDYLALVTLGFGEIVRVVLLNIWGPQGIAGIQPPLAPKAIGGFDNLYLLFYAVTFLPVPVALWILSRIDRSRLAKTWFAIRDNEIAAKSCGVNSTRWLLLAFVLGTAFAGIAGVIFAGVQRYVSPGSFVLEESILVLSIVVIAGGRSLLRLILAAAILSFLPELLRGLDNYRMLIYGVLLSTFIVIEEKFKIYLQSRYHDGKNMVMPEINLTNTKPSPEVLKQNISEPDSQLSVTGLTMRYGGNTAIDKVSFSIPVGASITALIGPNGAGKTTLFNCISGHCRPNEGTISFSRLKSPYTPQRCARAGIGRTFQTPHLFNTMTIRENVGTSVMSRRKGNRQSGIVNDILEYLGLHSIADVNVRILPLGMKRLIELGRALALQPKIILLDEIASGLNSGEKDQMAALIKRIAMDSGIGFMIVEHDMDFILPLASEVLVLDAGKLIARGTSAEVARNPVVIDAYLGKTNVIS
jgi:branched-chain amino acid transport system permease protein